MRTMERLPVACLCLLLSCFAVGSADSRVVVFEESDVILPCSLSTKEDITLNKFDWRKDPLKDVFLYDAALYYNNGPPGQDEQFKGRIFHFPDELQHGNASIIIRKTKVADSGNYTCDFQRLQKPQTFHIELVVGAAAKPSVKTLYRTKDQALLQCEVKGASPEPTVEWRDSSGNILHAEEPLVTKTGKYFNIIVNITVTKTDTYRCVATQEEINHQTEADTYVYISGTVRVDEGSDVILPCSLSTKEDIRSKLFDWKKNLQEVFLYDNGSYYDNGRTGQDDQFRGRVSHFPDELQHGNASITIKKTKLADSGNYTCEFPNLLTPQTSHIELVVAPILKDRSAENLPGAAAKPSVKTLHQTNDQALLQCKVKGASPKPKVEWRNSSGNILPAEEPLVSERGGSFNITIKTTVTKNDTYHCVATQKEIHHEAKDHTYVYISGAAAKPSVKILQQTNDQALLQCEVKGASPKHKVEWRNSSGNILPAEEPLVTKTGKYFNIIVNITVTKTDTYHCVATQEEINLQTEADTYVYISESSSGFVVAVVTFFITVLLVAVLLALLYRKGYIILNFNRGSTSTSQREEVALNGSSLKEATEP